MGIENIVIQARDVERTGRFWSDALGLIDNLATADSYEGRLQILGGPWFDICLEPVTDPPPPRWRLHLDLFSGADQDAVVDRLLALGATTVDIGQRDVPWVVLADPDGNAFCVMEERAAYCDTDPIAALPLDCVDPQREAQLYAALTGWVPADGIAPVTMRHPSLRGPLLEFCPEPAPKERQNRTHLDVRPEADGPDQAELVALALSLGATKAQEAWAHGHSWVVMRDLSGNEFCILADP
ncbi:MAG: VOC family protein [Tetrasphaera sp.]